MNWLGSPPLWRFLFAPSTMAQWPGKFSKKLNFFQWPRSRGLWPPRNSLPPGWLWLSQSKSIVGQSVARAHTQAGALGDQGLWPIPAVCLCAKVRAPVCAPVSRWVGQPPKEWFQSDDDQLFEKEVVKLVMQRCALLRKFTACLRFHNQLRFCSFRYFLFKSMQSNRFVPILKYSSFTTR